MLFVVAGCLLSPQIARVLDCADHPSFIWMMVITIGLDAYTSIPFSYLRYRKRPMRFATLKFVNIGVNIGLNLFFLVLCPIIWRHAPNLITWLYDPTIENWYVFFCKLIAWVRILLLLTPELSVSSSFN